MGRVGELPLLVQRRPRFAIAGILRQLQGAGDGVNVSAVPPEELFSAVD